MLHFPGGARADLNKEVRAAGDPVALLHRDEPPDRLPKLVVTPRPLERHLDECREGAHGARLDQGGELPDDPAAYQAADAGRNRRRSQPELSSEVDPGRPAVPRQPADQAEISGVQSREFVH